MLLQALPLAMLLFLFFPRLPGQFWALPAREQAMTGLDDEMSPGDVSELSISGALAFRVKFDGDAAAAARALLARTGAARLRRPHLAPAAHRVRASSRSSRQRRDVSSIDVMLEPHQRNWVFALDVVDATGRSGRAGAPSDFQLLTRRPADLDADLVRSANPRTTYTRRADRCRTLMRDVRPAAARRAQPALDRARARDARSAPAATRRSSQRCSPSFATRNTSTRSSRRGSEPNSVDDFLFNTRRGFCEHFASAFTMLARAAGIPARVVTGYQGGEFNPMSGYLIVRQSDAHAWSEVWLEGRGWVRVDPTAAVAPERIETRAGGRARGGGEPVPGRLAARERAARADAPRLGRREHVLERPGRRVRRGAAALAARAAEHRRRRLGRARLALVLALVAFFAGCPRTWPGGSGRAPAIRSRRSTSSCAASWRGADCRARRTKVRTTI